MSSSLLQVLMAGEMLHTLTLRREPREVEVCGEEKTKFMLVLNLETKQTKNERGGNVRENIRHNTDIHEGKTISIICIICFICIIFHDLRKYNLFNCSQR